ncbi:MAG: hypothetical protein OXG07_00110 [Anaerolineaceae bacterium]|nr:hypothetical protein [Anaerolineaceae bacterium]MCY3907631.1 hypothetical protein [Anaerolineaceae bacterium]
MSASVGRSAVVIIAAHIALLRFEDLGASAVLRVRQVLPDTSGAVPGGGLRHPTPTG